MNKFILILYLFSLCLTAEKWSIKKLIDYLYNEYNNHKLNTKYILISPKNLLKKEEFNNLLKKQENIYLQYQTSTYIFILEALEEDINEFIFGIIYRLYEIDENLNFKTSIVIVICLHDENSSIISGKKLSKYFSIDLITSYQNELDQFIKLNRINEGIIKILDNISSKMKTLPWKNTLILIVIILILYLMKKYVKITRSRYINSKAPSDLKINSKYELLKTQNYKEGKDIKKKYNDFSEKSNLKEKKK